MAQICADLKASLVVIEDFHQYLGPELKAVTGDAQGIDEVIARLRLFLGPQRKYIQKWLERKARYEPMIQAELGVSRAELGMVASVSTIAYAAGKFIFGPVIDRVGGRACFLGSLLLVAGFALAGGMVPSLGLLTVVYSANRFAGSASWGSMVKLVPGWFSARGLPLAMAWLSLSFVFGGVWAVVVAGQLLKVEHLLLVQELVEREIMVELETLTLVAVVAVLDK